MSEPNIQAILPETQNPKKEFVIQISIVLNNRFGSLTNVLKFLSSHHIEVIGISVQDKTDLSIVRFIVNDSDLTQQILAMKGFTYSTSPIVVVELYEPKHTLLDCLKVLVASEVNINFIYALNHHAHYKSLMALHTEDYLFASGVLNEAGIKVIYQPDLSR